MVGSVKIVKLIKFLQGGSETLISEFWTHLKTVKNGLNVWFSNGSDLPRPFYNKENIVIALLYVSMV
jgi:hypothetical protein